MVIKAHQNFISAGADIIITNSYQSNQNLIMDELKVTAKEADRYLASTVELAEKARKITERKIIIVRDFYTYFQKLNLHSTVNG